MLRLLVIAGVLVCAATNAASEAMQYSTFRSPPVALRSGEIANTLSTWGPLDWVPGAIGIRHFDGKIVDQAGNHVPLTEVYVHHWIIYRSKGNPLSIIPNGGLCSNLANIFGIGAELFWTQYDYPAPYAITTDGDEIWTANMHMIRTSNVPDVQNCIECHCASSRPPLYPFGGIQCCPDQSMCWGMENSTIEDTKNYYLEYTIGYVNLTKDVIPLTVFSLDVTAQHTEDCQTEYQIPAMPDGATHVLQNTAIIPTNWSMVYLEGHQHIGAINLTVEHMRNNVSLGIVCTATPIYGTQGSTPGNESGYIVSMPPCHFDPPHVLLAGDGLRLTSYYSNRTIPGGHPWHEGVMGLVFLAAVAKPDPQQTCMQMLHMVCGIPPYDSEQRCLNCAQAMESSLISAGCTQDMVTKECHKTSGGGNIPAPDEVTGMELHLTNNGSYTTANLTGPSSGWLGIAINQNSTNMQGALAWVYTLNDAGVPVVQVRQLGNHAPGTLINPNHPANITMLPNKIVQIIFTLGTDFGDLAKLASPSLPSMNPSVPTVRKPQARAPRVADPLGYTCFLFAQGTNSMTFSYHGSSRGWTCFTNQPSSP